MKKYYVSIPFAGSLCVSVMADNEDEALELGKERIESLDTSAVLDSIEWEQYDVYEE